MKNDPPDHFWYWYVARDNELFIDMDRYAESIGHVRRRLQGAIECGSLKVQHVELFPSATKNHAHMIIVLKDTMPTISRFAWEMLLHGDIYRAASNFARFDNDIPAPDILICRNRRWLYDYKTEMQNFHRLPDCECQCKTKHNRATMETCTAAIMLRGDQRTATFFGKPSNNPCAFLPE